ncbi:MAG: hypothetical protein ACKO6N_29745 [Myxococcota bacterium]
MRFRPWMFCLMLSITLFSQPLRALPLSVSASASSSTASASTASASTGEPRVELDDPRFLPALQLELLVQRLQKDTQAPPPSCSGGEQALDTLLTQANDELAFLSYASTSKLLKAAQQSILCAREPVQRPQLVQYYFLRAALALQTKQDASPWLPRFVQLSPPGLLPKQYPATVLQAVKKARSALAGQVPFAVKLNPDVPRTTWWLDGLPLTQEPVQVHPGRHLLQVFRTDGSPLLSLDISLSLPLEEPLLLPAREQLPPSLESLKLALLRSAQRQQLAPLLEMGLSGLAQRAPTRRWILELPDPEAVKLYRLILEPHASPPPPILFESEPLPLEMRTPEAPRAEYSGTPENPQQNPAEPQTSHASLRRPVGLSLIAAGTLLSLVGGGIYGYHYLRGYQQTVTPAEAEEILAGVQTGRVLGLVGAGGAVLGATLTFVLP